MIPVKLMYQNSKNTNNSFVIVGRYDYIILKKMYKHILDADIIREIDVFFQKIDDMLGFQNFIDEIRTYCTTSTKDTITVITELRWYHYQG